MNYKKYIRYIGFVLVGAAFASCSDDKADLDTGGNEADGGFYLTINVSTPEEEGTRSSTTTDGGSSDTPDLAGTNIENRLNNATIYFCVDDKVVASFTADYVNAMNGTKTSMRVEMTDKLNRLTGLVNKTVQVYVIGNTLNNGAAWYTPSIPNDDMSKATFSVSGVDEASSPVGDFGTAGRLMPLVNAKKFEFTVRDKTGSETDLDVVKSLFSRRTVTISWWDLKDSNNNSEIDLERAVARIEYKDKRKETETDAKLAGAANAHKFKIGSLADVYVKLYSLTPFNVNKTSYLLRHAVAGDNTKATGQNAILLGKENGGTGYNWISGPDWNFGSNAYTVSGRAFWNTLALSSEKDKYEITGPGSTGDGTITVATLDTRDNGNDDGYHPWCYVMENTVPSIELMADYTTVEANSEETPELIAAKYATGVAFKVLLLGKDGTPLVYEAEPDAESNYPSCVRNSDETERAVVITKPEDGNWVELREEEYTDASGETQKGYFMTYIACIVHNDGAKNGNAFAPMFYGVVRNNTYRISINSIADIPLPQEPGTLFLDLDVKVLPWVLRKNAFTF